MASLLNPKRPPVFCPGCSHDRALKSLDQAFQKMDLGADEVVIVSDIGCSGLFDTFFDTHALHGLHGRALTYAAGIKLACPHLKVVVTMGDGGLGIGAAHLLAACRRNLDLTLLVLNNFNFGMTGGQFSCTTPEDASVTSGFLNILEKPMDVCSVAANSGAPFAARCSVFRKDLPDLLIEAISFDGFSLVDIWSLCPARYGKRNPLSPRNIDAAINRLPPYEGPVSANARREYGSHYREQRDKTSATVELRGTEVVFEPSIEARREVVLLGTAGERVISAGSLLASAAISAGMHVTQKNDYDITVMRGPSVTELIVSPEPIIYTGVEQPDVILALSQEGVNRRRDLFGTMKPEGRVILSKGVDLPVTSAQIFEVDFKTHAIKKKERALAALSLLARTKDPVTQQMLASALQHSFQGTSLESAIDVLDRTTRIPLEALNT